MSRNWSLLFCVLFVGTMLSWPLQKGAESRPYAPASKALYAMSPAEVTVFLGSLQGKSLVQRIEQVSEQAMGTPYLLGPLGEGPQAPFDKDPLIDLKQVDCVTFCEQTLALALSQNYDQAFATLQKIRYKQGEQKMECRNHFTMADWVPNNAWLMQDITPKMQRHAWLTRSISHQKLFAGQNLLGIQVREADRTLKQAYIPEEHLLKALKELRSGDIGVLIQEHEGIFAAHTGFMIRFSNGQWVYRNATSLAPKKVVDTPYETLVSSLKKSKRLIGMSFVRPHQEKEVL